MPRQLSLSLPRPRLNGRSAWVRPGHRRRLLRRRRRLRKALIALAVVCAVALLRQILPPGGVVITPKREVPRNGVFFYQEDPAWASDAMGASGRTLGEYGDGVCSLASLMSMQQIPTPFPGDLNPGTLNAWLGENDAYDEDGNLKWNAIAALLGMELEEPRLDTRASALLEELVDHEIYAIVRVKRPDNGRMHEVLLVGSNHGKFTIVDSLDPSGTLDRLDIYKNTIYAMRYLASPDAEGEETV